MLYSTDKQRRPDGYEESVFAQYNIVKITSNVSQHSIEPMLVTTSTVKDSTRTGNECRGKCSSRIRTSRITPIHQHLSSHHSFIIIDHNVK